jgi:hypothetical protein
MHANSCSLSSYPLPGCLSYVTISNCTAELETVPTVTKTHKNLWIWCFRNSWVSFLLRFIDVYFDLKGGSWRIIQPCNKKKTRRESLILMTYSPSIYFTELSSNNLLIYHLHSLHPEALRPVNLNVFSYITF